MSEKMVFFSANARHTLWSYLDIVECVAKADPTAMDGEMTMIERVAKAIEAASCPGREGPFGLYDYSSYGHLAPHHVRDFRDPSSEDWGSSVVMSKDSDFVRSEYERLTREHIARAAIASMREPTASMIDAGFATGAFAEPAMADRVFAAMIDAALKDGAP